MATASRLLLGIAALALLSACAHLDRDGPPADMPAHVANIPDAVPRADPLSRYGNPPSYEVAGIRYATLESARGYVEQGVASWYGKKFHGRRTSSGEIYDMYAMTAAHRSLPLPTYVSVRNLENGLTAIVRVNDRGPFHADRVIDLSYAAAVKIGIVAQGTGVVEVRAIDPDQPVSGATRQRIAASPAGGTAGDGQRLFLQAGAFRQLRNAQHLQTKLAGATSSAVHIETSSTDLGPLFRVKVGPLATLAEVDKLGVRLASLGFERPRLVSE